MSGQGAASRGLGGTGFSPARDARWTGGRPPPPTALWTDDGNLLEIPLAHRDRDRVDAGIPRVDRRRRVITWEGLPETIGCGLRVEAAYGDVRGIAESRGAGAGLTLRLGRGAMRELVLIPPAHFAWLAEPSTRSRGGLSREEAIAGRLRTDDIYADAPGSGAFGGPTGKALVVPDDVRRDVSAVVAILRSAVAVAR